jgi:filamentous hemagglutinin family protein
MNRTLTFNYRQTAGMGFLLLASLISRLEAQANPTGGTVAAGAATFNTAGSQLTIHQTSANTFINWQSFNIGAGETTTFVQPSSSSVAWNQINDVNPSQILGNLNANGYVFLQNQNGFYVGGQASITAHGLVMTTANIPAPDLSSGGAWSFNAPPPTAKIINYGRIQTTGGGSAFLIASDIENNGTISAPGGKIGLYAGKKVLVSMSPDGRGLSAEVTLPNGSVDNEGNLIADAGSIAAQAKFVNQGGLIQANSVQKVNGTVELVASDSLNLESSSVISAQGGSTGTSDGGSVTLKSDNTFSDQAGSTINISGGTQGGNGGQVSICAPQMSSIQSDINGQAAPGFAGGMLTIDPANIWLASAATDPSAPADYTVINVSSYSGLSLINLQADNNLTLNTLWTLTDPGVPATLTLTAGNNITFNTGTGINAGNNWSLNLTAGTGFVPTTTQKTPASGSDGIYLNDNSYIQTQNGNINLAAANEVLVAADSNAGNDGIRTLNGGSIDVTAQYGNVNTGANPQGFLFKQPSGFKRTLLPPYYSVSTSVGGISTAAGGNVTINAGGDVTSYNPSGSTGDAGTGAFGSQPGNVTITAGGNVYGHYVLANGVGTITAGNTVGAPSGNNSFALSLINGIWNVNAPNGNIYLQEVRNPNGVFNDTGNDSSVAAHLFDYGANATVDLTAGNGVYLTGLSLPRLSADPVQVIYPPVLDITAGPGGVTLQTTVTLFPSVDQNLNITTTAGGSLVTVPNNPGTTPELLMSDSSQTRWTSSSTFSDTDLGGPLSIKPTDPSPVILNIFGNMANLTLITTKEAQITVGGNMVDCGFSGQNLRASDVTSIKVAGEIYNRSPYSFAYGVNIPGIPTTDLLPGMGSSWNDIFTLALNTTALNNLTVPPNTSSSQLANTIVEGASLFQTLAQPNGQLLGANPGFVYNPTTGRLGFAGQMPSAVLTDLTQPISVLHLVNGLPVIDPATGHYETDTINWVNPSIITALSQASVSPSPLEALIGLQNITAPSQLGYRLGGPGQFDISANSISLGNTYGILSCGVADPQGGFHRYNNLASLTPSGATVNVTVADDQTTTVNGVTTTTSSLDMLTSTIAAIGGGDVNVTSTGGSMDLGSQELLGIPRQVGFGIFTSGDGNVNVTASGDIDINGSRIAAFNGGNVVVESQQGTVNVGSGAATPNGVGVSFVNSAGQADFYAEKVYGSGIVAFTLINPSLVPGSPTVPGNITVTTPQGDIVATLGGILQEALNGSIAGGPTVTLTAGTLPSGTPGTPGYSPGHVGNINLGQSGVIGGTVNLSANGNISGVVISRQNSSITAVDSLQVTVLSVGSVDVSAGGSVSGTIVGVGGANVSGGSVSASVLGQNVSVNGGAATSTLGSSANATTSSQAASQQASQTADQVASTDNDDDDKKKKKKPVIQKTSRVTVILSAATPGR